MKKIYIAPEMYECRYEENLLLGTSNTLDPSEDRPSVAVDSNESISGGFGSRSSFWDDEN